MVIGRITLQAELLICCHSSGHDTPNADVVALRVDVTGMLLLQADGERREQSDVTQHIRTRLKKLDIWLEILFVCVTAYVCLH